MSESLLAIGESCFQLACVTKVLLLNGIVTSKKSYPPCEENLIFNPLDHAAHKGCSTLQNFPVSSQTPHFPIIVCRLMVQIENFHATPMEHESLTIPKLL